MKYALLTLIMIFIYRATSAQTIGDIREATGPFQMEESDYNGQNPGTPEPAPIGADFQIINQVDGYYIIVFIEWRNGSNIPAASLGLFSQYNYRNVAGAFTPLAGGGGTVNYSNATWANRTKFRVVAANLEAYSVMLARTWVRSLDFQIGVTTMPVKLRLKDFDFGGRMEPAVPSLARVFRPQGGRLVRMEPAVS